MLEFSWSVAGISSYTLLHHHIVRSKICYFIPQDISSYCCILLKIDAKVFFSAFGNPFSQLTAKRKALHLVRATVIIFTLQFIAICLK